MKRLLTVLILVFCTAAGAQDIDTLKHALASEIGRIDLATGITREQATAIGEHYGRRYIVGCGAMHPAVDRGQNWEVAVRTGVAGVLDRDAIVIGKHTGKTSWKRGPSVELAEFVESGETAPRPINAAGAVPRTSADDSPGLPVKIQFDVLPSGTVGDIRFKQSSRRPKCDAAARHVVEGWRFPPRERPITLIARMQNCGR